MKKQNLLLSILLLVLGVLCIGTGCALFVNSNLGSDPCNVMAQGIAIHLHIQTGTANSLIQAFFFLVALVWDRKYLGISSILGVVMIGPIMNLWEGFLVNTLQVAPVLIRFASCAFVTPFIIGIGVALVQKSNLGMIPNDITAYLISERTNKLSFKTIRIIYDLIQVIIGVLLGGMFGIGTVASALMQGPFMQLGANIIGKLTLTYEKGNENS